jgi:chromosome partitioning protein
VKEPFVIVFGHEKGGTGKSTLCVNVAIGLMYLKPGAKIVVLDTDYRQGSTHSFFQMRKKNNSNLFSPNCYLLKPSANDSKKQSVKEDIVSLMSFFIHNNNADYILIDTAGSYTNFTIFSLNNADLVITPISDSFIDINVLVRIENGNLLNGPYSEIVFEERKRRILNKNNKNLEWLVIRNKVSQIIGENNIYCSEILEKIVKNVGAQIGGVVTDRNIFKEIFPHGLAIADLPRITQDISLTKLKAFDEISYIVEKVLEKLSNNNKFKK